MEDTDKNKDDNVLSAIDELEKSMKDLEGGDDTLIKGMSKMKEDGVYKKQGKHMYMKKADGGYEKMDEDSPDYDDKDDDPDDTGKTTAKSLDDGEIVDVTVPIENMEKSIKTQGKAIKELTFMVKSLADTLEKQSAVMKSIGKVAGEDSVMIKAIHNSPAERRTTNGLKAIDRFQEQGMSKAIKEKLSSVTAESLADSMTKSIGDGTMSSDKAYAVNTAFRKGGIMAVTQSFPDIVKNLVKE